MFEPSDNSILQTPRVSTDLLLHSLCCNLLPTRCSVQFLKLKPADKLPMNWYLTCSVWQSAIAAASVALSLLFTAFDQDLKNEPMNKCSILLAVSQSFLTFALLTLLILLHAFGLVFITIASVLQRNK
uniref:PGG domain-containing protein n=1 Tax=Caenorhabditis tropicalis TaxID=1561998 RepID=A0A1I7U0E1_9PELO